jgi:hypothetical protein
LKVSQKEKHNSNNNIHLMRHFQVIGVVPLKEWVPPSFIFLSVLLPGHEVSSCVLTHIPPWCAPSPQDLKQHYPSGSGTFNPVSQNKSSLFLSLLSQVFFAVTERWLTKRFMMLLIIFQFSVGEFRSSFIFRTFP